MFSRLGLTIIFHLVILLTIDIRYDILIILRNEIDTSHCLQWNQAAYDFFCGLLLTHNNERMDRAYYSTCIQVYCRQSVFTRLEREAWEGVRMRNERFCMACLRSKQMAHWNTF